MSPRKRGRVTIVGALALAALVAAVSLGVAGAGAGERSAFALPRAQTFYMSGSQWAPYGDVNPAKTWDFTTGTIGLAYETRISVQPADRCVHPVARHEWHLANQQRLRHEHPSRREVQRRHDADAGGREVQLRPPEDPDAPAERALGVDGAEERQGCREHDRVHVRRQARLSAVRLLPLQRRDRPATRLQQVQRHRTDDGQSRREPDHRYRPVHVYVRCELHGSDLRLAAEKRLVGNQGVGPQAGAASTSSTSTTRRIRRRSPTSRPGTSISSTTSHRDRRSRASSRPSTTRPRITWVRTRRGSSRTRRRSRSTIRRSAARSRTRST